MRLSIFNLIHFFLHFIGFSELLNFFSFIWKENLRWNHRLMRHFVFVVYRWRRWIFSWRYHRFSRRVWWGEGGCGSWRRWTHVGKEDTFKGDSVDFKFHNQLWLTGWWVFCIKQKKKKLVRKRNNDFFLQIWTLNKLF